jgi:uncharacterized protein YgfB (UPF0149 family)
MTESLEIIAQEMDFDDWSALADVNQLGLDAAELQGLLLGFLVVHPHIDPASLMDGIIDEAHAPLPVRPVVSDQDLALLCLWIKNLQDLLHDDEYSLQLMMPDDEYPLATRAQALSRWASHFLSGLGWAKVDLDSADDSVKNALDNLLAIASAEVEVESFDTAEADLTELVEFCRVVVFMCAQEFHHHDCH